MSVMIETDDLTKEYNGKVVVDKLNLKIDEGEVFGFLGPNGAGKTTTILMLMGLTEPTSGSAHIGGFNSTREPLKVKRITGYVPEKVGFYNDLTAEYNLIYTARLNGIPEDKITEKVLSALDRVGLSESSDKNVGAFSKGMKQRLAIADVLVKDPHVAFLDEPTSGIDPAGISRMLDLIKNIAVEEKMTIVMSSHQLDQVQRICTRVGMMSKGKLVVEGPVEQLGKDALSGGKYVVEVEVTEITEELVEGIRGIAGVLNVERKGDLLLVSCDEDLRPKIARSVIDSNGLLVKMNIQSYELEDIYMKYLKEG